MGLFGRNKESKAEAGNIPAEQAPNEYANLAHLAGSEIDRPKTSEDVIAEVSKHLETPDRVAELIKLKAYSEAISKGAWLVDKEKLVDPQVLERSKEYAKNFSGMIQRANKNAAETGFADPEARFGPDKRLRGIISGGAAEIPEFDYIRDQIKALEALIETPDGGFQYVNATPVPFPPDGPYKDDRLSESYCDTAVGRLYRRKGTRNGHQIVEYDIQPTDAAFTHFRENNPESKQPA